MRKIYNEENLITDLESLFHNNYWRYILATNDEHLIGSTDPLYIPEIDNDKYVFEPSKDLNRALNKFFIVYGLTENDVFTPEQHPIRYSTVSFEVAYLDTGLANRRNLFIKILRYRQAMLNMLNDNSNVFSGYSSLKIDKLLPRSFEYDNNVDVLTGGVSVSARLY